MDLANFLKFKQSDKRIACIDFGASFLKVVWLEVRQDKHVLLAYVLKEFDANSKTAEEISAFLKEIFESNPISVSEVYLSISESDWIFIKKISLPHMSKDELFNAVKWQLKTEVPFGLDESILDLQVIREYTDSEGAKKIELFCVFAKKNVINKYISAVIACGLSPQKISSSVFNYCGILNSLPHNPEVSAVFDIGHTHSHVAIYQKNKLSFIRNLDFSTSKFAASLVGPLLTDKGKVEINLEKAESLMKQQGIPLDESIKVDSDIKAGQIIPLMRPLLETVVRELGRSFDYFKYESGLSKMDILYVTGGGADLNNLCSYLADQLKVKVERLPLPGFFDTKNVNAEKFALDVSQLSSAIGMGLSVCGINLLPREIKSQKIELLQQTALRIAAITIGAMFVFSWFMINFQIRDYKKRLNIAKLHLQSVEEVKIIKQAVDLRDDFITKIHTGKVPSGGLLKLIGSVVPSRIILNEFDFDQASHKMHLRGIVLASKDSVEKVLTDFMNNLEASKFVLEASLVNSKEDQDVNSFEIDCSLAK